MDIKELEIVIREIEIDLDRLHALYNQYFMGFEKMAPLVRRKKLDRKIQTVRKEKLKNTALRFKFNRQVQKYNTQAVYWGRICRQMEEGTYERDVNRARKRKKVRNEAEIASKALDALDDSESPLLDSKDVPTFEIDDSEFRGSSFENKHPGNDFSEMDDPFANKSAPEPASASASARISSLSPLPLDMADDSEDDLSSFFSRRSVPQTPPKEAKPKPVATTSHPSKPKPQISDDRLKSVYKAYIKARKRTKESIDNLSFEKIARKLKKQAAQKAEIQGFKVVIRNGKAAIKTVKD